MIPRILHWIWLGDAEVPAQHQEWMRGWVALHPGWATRVWHDADLPELQNRAAFDASRTWAQKADVVRYEVLLREGGVYVDTDVECLRNIEDLLEGADAVVGRERGDLLGNSVLAVAPGHPWMRAAVDGIPAAMRTYWLTLEQTGPTYLTRLTEGRDDVRVLPPVVFYPFASQAPGTADQAPAESYAVHHWAKSWAPIEIEHVRRRAGQALARLMSRGQTAVVVDDGIEVPVPTGCQRLPFFGRNGEDWGVPADGAGAVAALDEHRAAGVDWVVFFDSSAWWFEAYDGLRRALDDAAAEVLVRRYFTAFRLR